MTIETSAQIWYHTIPLEELNMSETITKSTLAAEIADKHDFTKKEAIEVVELIFATIEEELAKGNVVNITNFGKFEAKERKSHEGVNPHTGEKITVSATIIPSFKAARNLKAKVNQK